MRLVEENYSDKEARELWSELSLKLPKFFEDISITPALLHGDLWSGNVAETKDGPGKYIILYIYKNILFFSFVTGKVY